MADLGPARMFGNFFQWVIAFPGTKNGAEGSVYLPVFAFQNQLGEIPPLDRHDCNYGHKKQVGQEDVFQFMVA